MDKDNIFSTITFYFFHLFVFYAPVSCWQYALLEFGRSKYQQSITPIFSCVFLRCSHTVYIDFVCPYCAERFIGIYRFFVFTWFFFSIKMEDSYQNLIWASMHLVLFKCFAFGEFALFLDLFCRLFAWPLQLWFLGPHLLFIGRGRKCFYIDFKSHYSLSQLLWVSNIVGPAVRFYVM